MGEQNEPIVEMAGHIVQAHPLARCERLLQLLIYNVKINKIRDALFLAEDNLVLYLGLHDIETFKTE